MIKTVAMVPGLSIIVPGHEGDAQERHCCRKQARAQQGVENHGHLFVEALPDGRGSVIASAGNTLAKMGNPTGTKGDTNDRSCS